MNISRAIKMITWFIRVIMIITRFKSKRDSMVNTRFVRVIMIICRFIWIIMINEGYTGYNKYSYVN